MTDYLSRFYVGHDWSPDQLTVIPNFVPFEPLPAISRDDLDTPLAAPVMLPLSRLPRNKGFDTVLPSLTQLSDHFLWIGGVGQMEHELRTLARKLGAADQVRFLGWCNNFAALTAGWIGEQFDLA